MGYLSNLNNLYSSSAALTKRKKQHNWSKAFISRLLFHKSSPILAFAEIKRSLFFGVSAQHMRGSATKGRGRLRLRCQESCSCRRFLQLMQSMMWICSESKSGKISPHLGQACSGMLPCCHSVPEGERYHSYNQSWENVTQTMGVFHTCYNNNNKKASTVFLSKAKNRLTKAETKNVVNLITRNFMQLTTFNLMSAYYPQVKSLTLINIS